MLRKINKEDSLGHSNNSVGGYIRVSRQLGVKGHVELLDQTVRKTAFPEYKYKADPVLRSSSSREAPLRGHYVEAGILRALVPIPDGERLVPRLLHQDHRRYLIEMERLFSPSYHQRATEALVREKDPLALFEPVPGQVAKLHRQLYEHYSEIQRELGFRYQLRMRGTEELLARVGHYLRVIIYSTCPDLKELRLHNGKETRRILAEVKNRYGTTDSPQTRRAFKQRMSHLREEARARINTYVADKYRDPQEIKDNFVDRHNQIMYGTKKPEDQQERFLSERRITVLQGDLGPKHLLINGQAFDFDEAYLGPGELDLSPALFNLFTLTHGEGNGYKEREVKLAEMSLTYLSTILEREPTKEETTAFFVRSGEARLYTMLRWLAAECKAQTHDLRNLVVGDPRFSGKADAELRYQLIDVLSKNLQSFLDFWQKEVWSALREEDLEIAHSLSDQCAGLERLLLRTHVFDGAGDPQIVRELESLMRAS